MRLFEKSKSKEKKKFSGEDVCDAIFPFVHFYYNEYYMSDYSAWVVNELCDLPLEFVGTWEEYHEFSYVLDGAYRKFYFTLPLS